MIIIKFIFRIQFKYIYSFCIYKCKKPPQNVRVTNQQLFYQIKLYTYIFKYNNNNVNIL